MLFSKRRLSPYFLFALLLLLGWVSLKIVGVFLDYILIGLFLAYITYPVYNWLLRRVRYPGIASLTMLGAITAVVLVPAGFLTVELVKEMQDIMNRLRGTDLEAIVSDWTQRFNDFFGRDTQTDASGSVLPAVRREVESRMTDWLTHHLIPALAEGIIGVFVLLYIMYYSYTNGARFLDYLRNTLPMQDAHRDLLFHEVGSVVRAVFYGSVLTAVIQAVLGGIGFAIFGVPNVVFWSVIMFILALLPIIGPPLVWLPAGIYLLLLGDTFRGVGLLVYSAIMVSSIDNIIRPKLIGSRAHIHPVIILLGVLGGLAVFGFSGFLLGPLVLSVFVTILEVYRKEFALKMDDEKHGARMM